MIFLCENPRCGREIKIRAAENAQTITCASCGRAFRPANGKRETPVRSAYLDIETTGLSPYSSDLTVIGICLEQEDGAVQITQLVGEDISPEGIEKILAGVHTVYTYNGSRFDLKYIRTKLSIDIASMCRHEDLMYKCWKRNLYGGLKSVERQLGIPRKLSGMGGEDAVRLWYDHLSGDRDALGILLEYNREDILNLIVLRDRLNL